MWQDPIVAEVRQIRETYFAQFNYDLHALYRALKEQEEHSTRPKVSFPSRPVQIAKPITSLRTETNMGMQPTALTPRV